MKFTKITKILLVTIAILGLRSTIFAQDPRPHVVFLAGEEEYGAHWTLPKIAADLETRFNIKATVIHSWRSGAHDYDMPGKVEIPEFDEIKNLEVIKEADLLVMHIRFRIPPPEQLQILQDYFDSGKPAIAFRTTSHGMWAADQKAWFVPFFGGHYKGHMPNSEGTTTIVPAEQLNHPILRGVPKKNSMNDIMGIYVTAPLNDSATPLMMGKTGLMAPAQPVTWINEYKKGQKIFYTSLGGLESFIDPGFINMVYNAVFWALDREVPEHGVLGMRDLSFYENESPFDKNAFGLVMANPGYRPAADLELENAKVLDAEFQPLDIPSPPKANIPKKAIVLFDGKDLSKWRHWDLSADPVAMLPDARAVSPSPEFNGPRWKIIDGTIEARPGYGSLLTKEEYGNYRLHFDFLIPQEPDYIPEHYKGSGGIYLDGRYEIKILDSYGKEPSKISNGSIFNQIAPTSNPSKPVNTWQSMDIEYRQNKGQKPNINVTLNGTKIHDNVKITNRSSFSILENEPLFMSTEEEGSGIYSMNTNNWAAEIEFKTLGGGGGNLLTNTPKDKPWNENSKGLMLYEGRLVFRNRSGDAGYQMVQEEDASPLNNGEWHKVALSAEDGKITVYVDGKKIKQFDNNGSTSLEGHVLRIGQGENIFQLGASKLPVPFMGEIFDGEIKRVRFFNKALSGSDISQLNAGGEELSKESISLDWQSSTGKRKDGPIRLQSDLSKIRYANIWVQPLKD
jgi:type 1 glutamine amidotransferase